ncbi:glycoside hydrolase family 38 C-terminal domain-containing protein [Nonomuraea sp. NPDC046570]|uniref:glycoside hydrolase family 38 N-terminal domain-containing protein n=1 Tax=Nonomuraea sp. NPDC046570 TaxID=3155255 RepID=UPI0033E3C383
MSTRITAVESTDLFLAEGQVVRVHLEGAAARVTVTGSGLYGTADGTGVVEVPIATDLPPGTAVPVVVTAADARFEAEVTVEEPGWTMYLVSHFHYDPVWWNTQAAYTSPWEMLAGDATTRPLWERNGFALVEAHLDLALRDPDYAFVLAEIDYLKPFFDTHPHRLADLRALMAEGRIELVGGTYNEPNTNLTGAETTIRNIVYGVGYQRDILGGDPATAWQLDVFGHDPQFPGYLAAAGLTGSAWARGPFHQWGPIETVPHQLRGPARAMQFPSEFEWISPSGLGVLTHYMPHHYSAGWWMDSAPSLEEAMDAVYELYRRLKPVGATRNLLLPVGTDYSPPNKWVTAIHREWASRYVWPRFVCGTPRDFLSAVRASAGSFSPQTRDMNPVYTGKDVSYIDTKQAQRAGEVAAVDAEKLATLAVLHGLGSYPHAALDKVWRQLAYGAHHDAITGSESDQVYIDLLSGWREAYDLAASVVDTSLDALVGRVDTTGDGLAVVVANTLSFDRTALASVPLPAGAPSAEAGFRLVDDRGEPVAAMADRGMLRFLAEDVPALGWRTWRLLPPDANRPAAAVPGAWTPAEGATIANARYRVTADPARGGALTSVTDLASGRELLQDGTVGNELRLYAEYPEHPRFGEGPWHLLPTGEVTGSADGTAAVRAERGPLGERLMITGAVDGLTFEQVVTLWHGVDRVECVTRVVDFAGADRLLRVRFPIDLPGALPVSEVAGAVVGRGFALPDVDSADAPWTLDNPANTWFGLSATARVRLHPTAGGAVAERALGVAEVVVPDLAEAADLARDLVVGLARAGVTATTSSADWSRYGWLEVDSNLPDFRVVIGGPGDNEVAADLLNRVGAEYTEALSAHGRVWVPAERPLAEVWRPNADLRDPGALPALVISREAVAEVAAEAATGVIHAACPGDLPASERLTDHTAALLTYGLPGFAVDATGALHLSLMRSCTGWPSGVWIDPPRRTAPDGTSFQLQHWTHEFRYALVSGKGDWRSSRLPAQGQEFNHPLYARAGAGHGGDLPARHSLLRLEPQRDVLISTLKPTGNPIAHGHLPEDGGAGQVTLRVVEATGLGAEARVSGSLRVREAHAADLLERAGEPVKDFPEFVLGGAEVATVVLTPETDEDAGGVVLGPVAEVAQPVFSRYWLHNRGPAPMGYLPVSVTSSPGLLRTDGEPVEVRVVVATQLSAQVAGVVEMAVPGGWAVEPARVPYTVERDRPLEVPVTVTPAAGAGQGLYFVAARAGHGGQDYEDVVTVAVGEPDAPTARPEAGLAEAAPEVFKGTPASEGRPTGLGLAVADDEIVLRAGESGVVTLLLGNDTRDEIRGEAQLVSPWGTWDWLPEAVLGFTVGPGERAELAFPVTIPPDADPGHAWALPKVMWFGRAQYGSAVRLEVKP